MARWADDHDAVPERLARFVPDEWPGEDPAGDWGRAARDWLEAHPGRSLPLASDPVEVLQWVVELRRSLARAGHPHPGPKMPASPWAPDVGGGRSWRAGRVRQRRLRKGGTGQ